MASMGEAKPVGDWPLSTDGRRHFAVIGDPIAHSRSPQLHSAAYRALGVTNAEYSRIQVPRDGFADFARECLPRVEGVSVTMPHKEHAHNLASQHDAYGYLGVCNTLIPVAGPRGRHSAWAGFNTDIAGILYALQVAGVQGADGAALFGSGATSLSLAVALLELGCTRFLLCARNEGKLRPLEDLLASRGARTRVVPWQHPQLALGAEVVASALAVPGAEMLAERLIPHVGGLRQAPAAFFDVLYEPSPTPLQRVHGVLTDAVGLSHAPAFATGAHMLAGQAARQVELMLEIPAAPVEAMYAAAFGPEKGTMPEV